MKKLLILFFLFTVAGQIKAAIFTITSNANAGTGSLREAITLANANGVAATDYIYFNLPGSTLTDVTIALETELPVLTSNLVIDATTQPFSALSNPNIRVSLIRVVTDYFSGLRLDNSSNVEIYGILFSNFKADPLGPIAEKKGGIYLLNTSNAIIGAPNKPNCFSGNYAGILSPFVIPRADVQNIKISSNIFGLSENGLNPTPNESGIDMSFLKNSIIGGDTPEEGNLIASNTRNGIALGGADGEIKIENNTIGLDKNGTLKPSIAANGIYVNGATSKPFLSKNIIGGQLQGILLDYVNSGFVIAANKIGTGVLGTENWSNGTGIHINFSLSGTIGGSNITDQNQIAYNKLAILIEISYPVSILKNSLYCNETAVSFKNIPVGKEITYSKIGNITALGASGIYLPDARVELFYTDSCPDCEGKIWLATIPTDATGAWAYNGLLTGKITSMGTNADGATSGFSKPVIDDSGVLNPGIFCGETNGSITNLNVYDASVFNWYNASGQLVGTSKDLEHVAAGIYYLKAGQLGACDVTSANYEIKATGKEIDDKNKVISDESCGASNGSIRNITVANHLAKTWYNVAGNVVSNNEDLINVPAGGYYFKAGSGACEVTSPVYPIKNVLKNYNAKDFEIIKASCGLGNGSINIKTYQSDVPVQFSWTDASGNVVGLQEDLVAVFPGTYTLSASDGLSCVGVVGSFTIEEATLPVINFTNLKTFISCDGKTVSISGVDIVGTTQPYTYHWIDENDSVVANDLVFKEIKPGKFQLLVKDRYGCEVSSSVLDLTKLENRILQVPNSITPNGDGVNDTWKIPGVENYPNAEFYVFNRLGNQLFYSKGYAKEFDGTYNGKPLSVGVYYFLIDLKTDCGRISGSLTILK